jgi:hypothetical protein
VGGVIVNDIPTYRIDHMPYGGVKDSGLGREGLRWAIEDMTELRLMVVAPQALTVENEGSVALTYTMSTSATDPDSKGLRDQLTLVIREMDTDTAGCANFNGTQLYSGALSGGAISSERTLAASASEVLCFRVNLDLSTGNAFQGATTAATFTFSAEQD